MTKTLEKNLEKSLETLEAVVVRFAGDSGDGMQLTGTQFTNSSALAGNDISTFPDFPAEIRAPQGTLPGVSGFQICFGSAKILTPGDAPDVLIAMNPAALKVNLKDLTPKGMIVANTDAFTEDNLKKAGYTSNPLDDKDINSQYRVVKIPITELTLTALEENPLKKADKMLSKNFFALGLTYWLYDRSMDYTLEWIKKKFSNKPDVIDANSRALKAGFFFAETTELISTHYKINPVVMEPGVYRKISGNEAIAYGVVTAAHFLHRDVVYASYPITPASDILAYLAQHKNFGIKTVQAEDEIAAIGIAIGASYAGAIGVTGTSGPGICLKSEAMGFAVITELPLIIFNVQRGGPSTGLPTKTEQADLLQALYCRNGESPMPVLAPQSPSDCFDISLDAMRIAFKYNTPVLVLSDGSLANGAEPWKIPSLSSIDGFKYTQADPNVPYVPYRRDPQTLARKLAIPGMPGLEHRIGGLEKNEQGGVSYDPENHEKMVRLRASKIAGIAKDYTPTTILGKETGDLLVIGWGSTYGAITMATEHLQAQKGKVSAIHLRYLNPLPLDLGPIIRNFKKVLVPEMNMGQLCQIIRSKYLVDAVSYTKIQGRPFTIQEIIQKMKELLQ